MHHYTRIAPPPIPSRRLFLLVVALEQFRHAGHSVRVRDVVLFFFFSVDWPGRRCSGCGRGARCPCCRRHRSRRSRHGGFGWRTIATGSQCQCGDQCGEQRTGFANAVHGESSPGIIVIVGKIRNHRSGPGLHSTYTHPDEKSPRMALEAILGPCLLSRLLLFLGALVAVKSFQQA